MFEIYKKQCASNICVSNSKEEPIAILIKRWKSLFETRPLPYAIFEGIETAHL